MGLKKIKLHSTELNEQDSELIDSILIDALKEQGIDLYNPNDACDSFAWEIELLVVTKPQQRRA
jgi:hypothetical protein